jgi:hypothetical protein
MRLHTANQSILVFYRERGGEGGGVRSDTCRTQCKQLLRFLEKLPMKAHKILFHLFFIISNSRKHNIYSLCPKITCSSLSRYVQWSNRKL